MPSRMTTHEIEIRREIATIARTAHWLLDRAGTTKRSAALDLADSVRKLNRLTGSWTDDEMTQLLERAAVVATKASGE